ncbi:MAG: hypothetical protein Q8O76_12015, partial [Chloroflexota bacterium]|nr:hypothetical protein [Chloroflexota bacterium]
MRYPSVESERAKLIERNRGNPGKGYPRLAIKAYTYRGKQGFLVYGKDYMNRRTSAFLHTKEGAVAWKRAMSVGDERGAEAIMLSGANPKGNPSRNANKEEQAELVNLYHLARTALADKKDQGRWARMDWAAREFAKAHKDWTSTAAYLSLEMALAPAVRSSIPPNAPSPHKQRGGYGHPGGTYGRRKENPMSNVAELKCPSCGGTFPSGTTGVGECDGCGAQVAITPGPNDYTPQKELATWISPTLDRGDKVIEPPLTNPTEVWPLKNHPETVAAFRERQGTTRTRGRRLYQYGGLFSSGAASGYRDRYGSQQAILLEPFRLSTTSSRRTRPDGYHIWIGGSKRSSKNPTFGEMDASSITDFPDLPAPGATLESTSTPEGFDITEGTVETKPATSDAAPSAYQGSLHEYIRGVGKNPSGKKNPQSRAHIHSLGPDLYQHSHKHAPVDQLGRPAHHHPVGEYGSMKRVYSPHGAKENPDWPAEHWGMHLKSSDRDSAIYSEETPNDLKAFYQEVHIDKVKSTLNQREFWRKQRVSGNRMGPRANQETRMTVGGPDYFRTREDLLAGKGEISESLLRRLAGEKGGKTKKNPITPSSDSLPYQTPGAANRGEIDAAPQMYNVNGSIIFRNPSVGVTGVKEL